MTGSQALLSSSKPHTGSYLDGTCNHDTLNVQVDVASLDIRHSAALCSEPTCILLSKSNLIVQEVLALVLASTLSREFLAATYVPMRHAKPDLRGLPGPRKLPSARACFPT